MASQTLGGGHRGRRGAGVWSPPDGKGGGWEPDPRQRHRRKHTSRLAAPNGGVNSSWQVGRQKPASTTHDPLPGRPWRTGNVSRGQPKSAAKPLKISQVQSKTAKFRVGHRNQGEGRGMSEAVTAEDKTNQYNANVTGRQNSRGRPLQTHTHHGAGEWPPSRLRRRTS